MTKQHERTRQRPRRWEKKQRDIRNDDVLRKNIAIRYVSCCRNCHEIDLAPDQRSVEEQPPAA